MNRTNVKTHPALEGEQKVNRSRPRFLRAGAIAALGATVKWPKVSHAGTVAGKAPTFEKQNIAVIGAGAFGGWTALHLLRKGARVTLLGAWGPGNSRASSGGETRVIRGI